MKERVIPCGDCAATLEVGGQISLEVHHRVTLAMEALRRAQIPGVVELVPTYGTVCIHYDPFVIDYDTLLAHLREIPFTQQDAGPNQTAPLKEIPVCYGGEYGPDLSFVAQHCGLSEEEVIRRHSEGWYLVYMLGFLPGFAYLGGMDETISCPRLTSPRSKIPAGSVGIAGEQTGIYPLSSPGGWQLIGRTPVRLFAPEREADRFFLSPGDRVRFVPVTPADYRKLEEEAGWRS